jgi:4-hydroxy-tetrahydrodipicolinate synthase
MKPLPKGIVSVLQTPFDENNQIDFGSLEKLINESIHAGVSGYLYPVVASEVSYLSESERSQIIGFVKNIVKDRIALIVGASSSDIEICRRFAKQAEDIKAHAYLISVPDTLYGNQEQIVPFFKKITQGVNLPLIIQDFQFNGVGMHMDTIKQLYDKMPKLVGLKIETQPSGPKYTHVKESCGPDFWVAGGWAITQMIEAMDRGVDAMIPESSMVRVYVKIYQLYSNGERSRARKLFRSLQPVLMYSNQDVGTSIAFFKRLLVAKGIFKTMKMRWPGFEWDSFNSRIADELIKMYFDIEKSP